MKIKYLLPLILFLSLLTACSHETVNNSTISEEETQFTKEQIKTLESVERLDEYPLYVMYYKGNYGFNEYLKEGREISAQQEENSAEIACSCVAMYNSNGDSYFGRNLDWHECPILVLFTNPPDGYASISVVDLIYFGFTNDVDITQLTLDERKRLLSTPYVPFDGMNEYGVCIGEMTMRSTQTSIDSTKITLGGMEIMRAVLDYAKNTEAAIELFKKYNITFIGEEPPMHYMVSDPSGDSAIIEYIDGELKIIRNTEPWQICTNYQIFGKNEEEKEGKCYRYDIAYDILKEKNGQVSSSEAMMIMDKISQTTTQWSSLYNMATGEIEIAVGNNYDNVEKFNLPLKK